MIQGLENLYRSHRQGLFTYALSLVSCPQMAEDVIQNVFARLFRDPEQICKLRDEQQVSYIFKCVKNNAIDLIRNRQRTDRLSEGLYEEFQDYGHGEAADESLLVKERAALLNAAIEELSEQDKEAVVLKLFAGLTFEQAGESTQTSPKTIATRYRRALMKLENHLRGQL